MKLPGMPYGDGYGKKAQTSFGGYEHTPGAGEGTIWDMKNLCSDACPLLTVRRRRGLLRTLDEPWALGAHGALYWVDGDGFWYDGKRVGTVTPGRKSFAGMGTRILIWPDKTVYDTATGVFESLEAQVSGSGVTFGNGELYGEVAECNSVTCRGIDFSACFKAGDGVEITGCTRHPENNKTSVVREISEDGHTLRFYEYVFRTEGTDEAPQDYTEPGTITFSRSVPDMDFICANENRLWGCRGDTIYCSKLGDPKNFNVFDGVGTDSFAVDAGSAGEFTACCSFLGYPCFFKEDRIYKVYGDLPSNFQVMGGSGLGVKKGCAGSLAAAGNALFFLSTAGFMTWGGGMPSPVGDCLGGRFARAEAGGGGLHYRVSAERDGGSWHLFVYDTRYGLWHREDDAEAVGWAWLDGKQFLLRRDGTLWDLSGLEGEREDPVEWMAEFADFTEESPDAKGVGKVQVRLELERDARAVCQIRYDSEEEWKQIGTAMEAEPGEPGKRTFLLPVIPRRADHYRLRLEGHGGCRVYSIARERYSGSEMKSRE